MKSVKLALIFLPALSVLAAGSIPVFEKQKDGIVLELRQSRPGDPKKMRIQVRTESIIRVTAAPGDTFSTRPSLMVDRSSWPSVKWTVEEKNGRIVLSTSQVSVQINPKTGAVIFTDASGKVLLREKCTGGKIITPAEVMGESVYHIQNLFDSPEDEAFYGLGAHQNAVMNYKGTDVDLWQHNIVDINPFLVSSRNHGILWDNNSQTKFGDIREYQPISSLTLYGKDGKSGGLSVEYFSKPDFDSLFTARQESLIEHDFVDSPMNTYPEGYPRNVASVRWSGEIESPESGVHKFRFYSSGYAKLWLNGELVVDSWRQNWNPWMRIAKLNMEAGKRYSIRIDWIPMGGYIGIQYLTPEKDDPKTTMSLWSEVADQIDYYFIHGSNLDEVVQGYRDVTGRAPMMPKWSLGLWQCRQRYETQEQLLDVVREFRKRKIPLDNIVQDWFYWPEDKWGDHDFDKTRFPDPDGMVKILHDSLNTRIMISVWPKFYVGTENYKAFNDRGWLYKRNVEKGQRDWVGPGYVSTFYDPYGQDARNLYWKGINEKLFSKGFDAWWLDSTEPDINSNLSEPERRSIMGPTGLGTAARYLNTFSLMNSKAVYEGQRQADPNRRVFILTRSAFAGQQRYAAASWSGDVAARWYDLKAQVPAGLNFCLAGIPYWTTDIGGFAVEPRCERPSEADLDEWRELMTRWFQFGTFCPLLRVHGEFPYREMFNVAPENHPAFRSMLAYDKLRYRLMPYIYSLSGMVTQQGYTIMRGLAMDFGQDPNVLNVGDQFMFGPALLVNPVTEYKARTRPVVLPNGSDWYDIHSGGFWKGGQTIQADAPYEQIPVFVKSGSIIPCGPEIQYTEEKPADPIRLFVYAGADGSFALYEDENVNYGYEKGRFAVIPLSYQEKTRNLSIGKRQGEFPGMLQSRTFEIFWISDQKRSGLDFQAKPDTVVQYSGEPVTVAQH